MQRLGLIAPFALALGLALAIPKETRAPIATAFAAQATNPSAVAQSPAPHVALLLTAPRGDETSLVFQQAGERLSPANPVATLRHLPGGTVKGALMPGSRAVLAVADWESSRDPSWGAALVRVEEGKAPKVLADRVYTNTRPLILADGRVLVTRGRAGAEPKEMENRLRVDAITIDEIDAASGTARTLHAYSGYLAFLAGALDREAFVYRVGPEGADVVAVDTTSGKVRVLAPSVLPFARDFSVDAETRSLLFTERDERSSQQWVVDRMDVTTGARTRLVVGQRMALVPHALPGGRVAFNPEGDKGLTLLLPNGRVLPLRPLGDGVDVMRGLSHDGQYAALLHTAPGQLAVPFVVALGTGRAVPVTVPKGMRVDIAGVVQ